MTLETKYYKLEKLIKWEHRQSVDEMLLNGVSPHKVSDWCKEQGFSISHPKLYEYKAMLQKAISKQITVAQLLGIGQPRRTPILLDALRGTNTVELVKSESQVLDGIIQLGFNALTQSPTVKLQDAMRAIELKHKLTGGNHGGFTSYGLDQLRELEKSKFDAMVEVVMKYVPDEVIPELEEAIANAERNFYETKAPDMLEEYDKATEQELRGDDVVVSDTQF
jgi:hypothetical protein